jgi:hypothetical protein
VLELDAALASYSGDHLGVLTRDDCRRLGATDRAIDGRIGGVLVPVHWGVFRHAAAPPTFEGTLRAAVLAGGATALASGPSAMRLYGIRGRWDDTPEVTIVGTDNVSLRGVRVRRIDRLDPSHVHRRFGIPVLAPPVALLLLGAVVPPGRVESAVHDMVFQRFTTRAGLLDALATYGGRGRRGTTALRRAIRSLTLDGAATQTNLELDLLRLLRLHGLPDPVSQLAVVDADGRSRRLDLAYPDRLLDVEADGDRWHLNPGDRTADRARDAALAALGWRVLRFGTADVHVHPARTIAAVRASLADLPPVTGQIGQRT